MKSQAIRSVSFTTAPYEREHGKAPRGYGSWAFQAYGDQGLEGEIKFFTGTLGEAKKQAKEFFAKYLPTGYADVAILG